MKRLLVVLLVFCVIPITAQTRRSHAETSDQFEWNGQYCDIGATIEYTQIGRLILSKPVTPTECTDRPGWTVCNERREAQIQAQKLALMERLQRVVEVCGLALGY